MNDMTLNRFALYILLVLLTDSLSPQYVCASIASEAVKSAIRQASVISGREIADDVSREGVERVLGRAMKRYGDDALRAAADGGLELIESSIKHGDDLMKFAVQSSPGARRVLALKADTMTPLVRKCGPEIIEIEAKAPGLAVKAAALWDPETLKTIAVVVPAEDLPRLIRFAELSKSPGTRKLLFKRYAKEGSGILDRFPYKRIMAGGVLGYIAWLAWQWPPWGPVPSELKWWLLLVAMILSAYFMRRLSRWWPIRKAFGFAVFIIRRVTGLIHPKRKIIAP